METNQWAQKIADLEAAGWSLTGIGKQVELSPQSLSDIKQGRSKEPRGMAAVRLYAMHIEMPSPDQIKAAA